MSSVFAFLLQDRTRKLFGLENHMRTALAAARESGISFVIIGYYKKSTRPNEERSQITKVNVSCVKPIQELQTPKYEGDLPENLQPVPLSINLDNDVAGGNVPEVTCSLVV